MGRIGDAITVTLVLWFGFTGLVYWIGSSPESAAVQYVVKTTEFVSHHPHGLR
jgi:hypothetical protein